MHTYTAFTGTWKDLSDNSYQVDILQNTPCTPQSVDFAYSPELERVFDFDNSNAQGAGLFLSLISDTNMKYVDLFTGDIKEFQVIGKKNGSTFFTGWLDTENYNEPMDSLEGYDVEVTCNDGIAILERMKYVDMNQNHFTGVTSLWNIITTCLSKIELDWQYIYVSSGLTVSGVASNNTVFHVLSGFQDNYYDEDNEPLDCRKVLEAALLNYKMIIKDNSIFIIYHELLQNSNITYKRFNYATKAYVDTVTISSSIGDLADIDFTDTNAIMEIQPAFNKAVVEYSPYRLSTLMDWDAKNDVLSNKIATTDRGYMWDVYTKNDHWDLISSGTSKFIQQYSENSTNPKYNQFYILMSGGTNYSEAVRYKAHLPYIVNNDDSSSIWFETPGDGVKRYYMRITVNAEFRSDWYDNDPVNVMRMGKLRCMLRIGGYKYVFDGVHGFLGAWVPYSTPVSDDDCLTLIYTQDQKGRSIDMENMNNKTNDNVDNSYYDGRNVNLDLFAEYPQRQKYSGDLQFSILNKVTVEDVNQNDQTVHLKYVKIHSVRIILYGPYGNEIDNSNIEYTGKGDEQFQKEAETQNLLLGSNIDNVPTEFGSLMKWNSSGYYEFVTGLTEQHTGTSDLLENILLKNYLTQSEVSRIVLNCNINQINTTVGHITYDEFFPGKKFRVQSIRSDLENMSDEVKLIEIVT